MANPEPTPYKAPLVDKDGMITRTWNNFLVGIFGLSTAAARVLASVALTGQVATIATTALLPTTSAGRFRVTVYARVTTPASVSSSIIPIISFTDDEVACTVSGAALTSNLAAAPTSWTFEILADASTPISYGATYASVGTAMAFKFNVVLESLT